MCHWTKGALQQSALTGDLTSLNLSWAMNHFCLRCFLYTWTWPTDKPEIASITGFPESANVLGHIKTHRFHVYQAPNVVGFFPLLLSFRIKSFSAWILILGNMYRHLSTYLFTYENCVSYGYLSILFIWWKLLIWFPHNSGFPML